MKISRRKTLTDREHDIVCRLASGRSNTEIGKDLGIRRRTVKSHLYNAMQRLGVCDRTSLLFEAMRRGEVAMDDLIAPSHVLGQEQR